jgi:predicted DNA-binding protein
VKESDRPGERISIRVPTEMYEALETCAKADRRTISALVKVVLEDYLIERGMAEAPPTVPTTKPTKRR